MKNHRQLHILTDNAPRRAKVTTSAGLIQDALAEIKFLKNNVRCEMDGLKQRLTAFEGIFRLPPTPTLDDGKE